MGQMGQMERIGPIRLIGPIGLMLDSPEVLWITRHENY
jgi:hypothetical protein